MSDRALRAYEADLARREKLARTMFGAALVMLAMCLMLAWNCGSMVQKAKADGIRIGAAQVSESYGDGYAAAMREMGAA